MSKRLLEAISVICLMGIHLLPMVAGAAGFERRLLDTLELPPAGTGWAAPYVCDNMLIVRSGDKQHLLCYDLETLDVRWVLGTDSIDLIPEFTDFNNMAFEAVDSGQYLFGIKLIGEQAIVVESQTGAVIAARPVSQSRNALAVNGIAGECLVSATDKELVVYDIELEEIHREVLPGLPYGIACNHRTNELFVCIEDRSLLCRYSLDRLLAGEGAKLETAQAETGPRPFACCIADDLVAISCWDDSSVRIHDRATLEELASYPALPSISEIEFAEGCLFTASHIQAKEAYGSPGALLRIDPRSGEVLRRDLEDSSSFKFDRYAVDGTLFYYDLGEVMIRNDTVQSGLSFAYYKDSKVVVIDAETLDPLEVHDYPDGLFSIVCYPEGGLVCEIECGANEVKVYRVARTLD